MEQQHIFNLAILGGGPAGVSAAIYAARKEIDTLLLTNVIGGQSTESQNIHNWIGETDISGIDLAKKFDLHLNDYKDKSLKIEKGSNIISITEENSLFEIKTDTDEIFFAKHILYTLGSVRRKLDASGASDFEGRGVVYCASCDGPLYRNKHVAVIGGGNAAFESALQLVQYCTSVTLINRSEEFRADQITIDTLKKFSHFSILTNTIPTLIEGDFKARKMKTINTQTKEEKVLDVEGIFVEIGQVPNTEILSNILVKKNTYGYIEIDPWTQKTSHPNIWAAGDCTNILFHQNNIASGDGVKAIEHLFQEITKK